MAKEFNVTAHTELLRSARNAFLLDTAYAIAIARPAGALVARRAERARLVEATQDGAEQNSDDSI